MSRIPVTILSGYLGSGKTTIINAVLAQPHGLRVAVLVNDFGPVNVDARLIRSQGERVVELSNGCVCCSIGDDLGAALDEVAAWDTPPQSLLLEASGVAEPSRIAMAAGNWPGFELDAVIVAADAETIRQRAGDKFVGKLVQSQLRSADIIALTKTDLVAADHAAGVTDWLRQGEPGRRIVPAPFGQIFGGVLFKNALVPVSLTGEPGDAHAHFHTVAWVPAGPVDTDLLRQILTSLPPSLHRAKGFVTDDKTGQGVLVQAVGRRCTLTPTDRSEDDCLVLISTGTGADLDQTRGRLTQACRN